jgi:hypothetical protein
LRVQQVDGRLIFLDFFSHDIVGGDGHAGDFLLMVGNGLFKLELEFLSETLIAFEFAFHYFVLLFVKDKLLGIFDKLVFH